ncbi:gap junction protein [Rhodovulum sulfidophilum]|uniref:Gap junction protein n=1 Tax=Rhodovulum sulfidophilum TaxID=35806 RepID=A0A0D6AXN5_RHOSU|nr:gap junction protein [Rhodovulum sulfidophilum]
MRIPVEHSPGGRQMCRIGWLKRFRKLRQEADEKREALRKEAEGIDREIEETRRDIKRGARKTKRRFHL